MSEEQEIGVEQEERAPEINPAEEKAKPQGWVPRESFRGDPAKWVDAETFVKRGENILPIVKERLDHVIKENQEIKAAQKEFLEYHKKTAEREFNRALQAIEQRKLDAVQEADTDAYQRAQREERELLKERPQPTPPANTPPPEFESFVRSNDWYNTDPEMKAYADNIGVFINSTRQLPFADVLREVEKEVKARYPHKFQNTRREAAPSVERSADMGLPVKNGKAYADLPADAKTACDKFIRTIPGFTKEQYLKDYFGD